MAWIMGIEDILALSGTLGRSFEGLSVVSTASVDDVDVANVVSLDPVRLVFEIARRSVGVNSDSRALGSSKLVYLPIEGL